MAAFIQKLFKSRKANPATAPRTPAKSEPSQPSQEETRQHLKEQQERQLKSSPDQNQLASLAIDGLTAAIRLEAAAALTDEHQLQQVQKQAKGRDKSVYQTVKQALQSLKEQQAAEAAVRQRIKTLIGQAEDQAASEDLKLYQARLEALQENWSAVQASATAEQAQQFLEAVHQCRERLKQIEQAKREEARHREQALQRTETLALLEQTLNDLTSQESSALPSLSALDALQKTQENRWLEATRDTQVDKQEQKNYEMRMLALRNYLSAVRRFTQAKDVLSGLAQVADTSDPDEEHRQQASELLKQIEWPSDFPQPAELGPVRKLAGKPRPAHPAGDNRDKQKAAAEALHDTLPKLESALEAKQFKESRQLLKLAQNQFQQLDGRQRKQLQARMQLLTGQFRELSDWQGFATEPKQLALCEQMEHLADQPIEPEIKAERIKELQNEWRDLGGSSDRSLWSRFKAASDTAYEPCKAYFEAKSDLKQANLHTREAICDQLEHFLANADWSTIDWKAAERIHQTARQEWKSAWPVDFKDNRQVQKRFDELLKQLERPLDEERLKNEALKQAIVDRARALIEHEPLQDAMEQAKALQTDWKAVGITRHREDRKMWQAFRKACDQIFARRDAQRSARQQASEEADQAAQAVLAQYQQLDASTDDAVLDEARDAVKQIAGSALSAEVKEQVQQLRQRLDRITQARQMAKTLDTWKTLVSDKAQGRLAEDALPPHWVKLCNGADRMAGQDLAIRAEILAGAPTPEQDQQRRMEIQVQRLADGLGSGETEAPLKELERLVALWCIQPGDDGITPENADRLNRALDTLFKSD
jgi:hypothetical protein